MTFKSGQSGNPKDRPKGSRNRYVLYEKAVLSHQEELLKKGIEMAKIGNEQMLKLFLERLLPPKPKDQAVIFSEFKSSSSADWAVQGMEKLRTGEITPYEANQLLNTLSYWCKLIEVQELKIKVE